MRSRDISAISRASSARAKLMEASSDKLHLRARLGACLGHLSTAAISIACEHAVVSITRFERRVTGIRDHSKVRLRPRAMQIPRAGCGTYDVVAALHDRCRCMPNARYIVDQLALAAKETRIH